MSTSVRRGERKREACAKTAHGIRSTRAAGWEASFPLCSFCLTTCLQGWRRLSCCCFLPGWFAFRVRGVGNVHLQRGDKVIRYLDCLGSY